MIARPLPSMPIRNGRPKWTFILAHVKNLEQAYIIGNFEMFQHEMADHQGEYGQMPQRI